MSDSPKYDFSEAIQKRIVGLLLYDAASVVENIEIILPEYFENRILRDFVTIIRGFYSKYKRVPKWDEFIEEINQLLESNPKLPQNEYWKRLEEVAATVEEDEFEYVKDKVLDFARYQAVKQAIQESVHLIQRKKDYSTVLTKVRDAVMIGEKHTDLGTFYYENLEQRLRERRAGRMRTELAIPTGVPSLDRVLGGGLAPPELGIIMGSMKRGKTIVAVNFVLGAALDGRNAVHYVLESNEERTQVLYDACLAKVPKNALLENEDLIRKQVKKVLGGPGMGRIVIKHFPPNTASALTIEAHLQKLRMVEGFVPNLVVIDYLGLMRPADRQIKIEASSGGRYYVLGTITKELLALAHQYNFAIWLLHQSTRASRTKKLVDLQHSGDSIEPMRDADLIITLNQTDEEAKKEGLQEMIFFVAGGREVQDRIALTLYIDKSLCWLTDTKEAINESVNTL